MEPEDRLSTVLIKHLIRGENYINQCEEKVFGNKPSSDKWSKKEILGHLIDSGINNLQRFTTVQYEEKPFRICSYDQDNLVKANHYQESETQELLVLWKAVNYRICRVFDLLSKEVFSCQIILPGGEISDVKFLAEDYIDHLVHHLKQIMK